MHLDKADSYEYVCFYVLFILWFPGGGGLNKYIGKGYAVFVLLPPIPISLHRQAVSTTQREERLRDR